MSKIKATNSTNNATIEQRISCLNGGQLTLGIEGRFTNLRIWTGCNKAGRHPRSEHTEVWMRLDCANQYNAPLNDETYKYLDDKDKVIEKLLKFGFMSPISNLDEILEITKDLKWRELVAW